MHQTKTATDRLFKELEWLTREHEEKNAAFEERLKALDEEGEAGERPRRAARARLTWRNPSGIS